jgi:hypothetical protein
VDERKLGNRYINKFRKTNPTSFVFRIPDSPVGRKPFDAFIFMDGEFVAIEFKIEGGSLLPHQSHELNIVKKNGGIAKVVYFMKDGSIKEVIL